jgi:hypothetical protein
MAKVSGSPQGDRVMSQSHFTLSFSLKSPADAKAIAEELPPLMRGLFKAEDTIGTIHYSRFTALSDKTFLFLGDFDGQFGPFMADLAKHSGPVFDSIFKHVENPPSTPVADDSKALLEWTAGKLLRPLNIFTAYPDVTVKEIKAMASAADVGGAGVLNAFLVILPAKSRLAFTEMQLLLRVRTRGTQSDLEKVGTPYFAQFVPLEDNQVGFFTVYDGNFDTYIADFTKNIGGTFDLVFKFITNPSPSPCRKFTQEFIDHAAEANRASDRLLSDLSRPEHSGHSRIDCRQQGRNGTFMKNAHRHVGTNTTSFWLTAEMSTEERFI